MINIRILPPRQLKETLKPNLYLDHAERLLNEQIYGPECLISRKDEIYMGVHGGDVIKVFDNKVTHITKLGLSCGNYDKIKVISLNYLLLLTFLYYI